jgi:hypothetical protein
MWFSCYDQRIEPANVKVCLGLSSLQWYPFISSISYWWTRHTLVNLQSRLEKTYFDKKQSMQNNYGSVWNSTSHISPYIMAWNPSFFGSEPGPGNLLRAARGAAGSWKHSPGIGWLNQAAFPGFEANKPHVQRMRFALWFGKWSQFGQSKHWKYKSWITFKSMSLEMWKPYQ